jgi:hypothetical protein
VAQFEYWAVAPNGETQRGIEDAPDRDTVLRRLLKKQLVPLDIKKASDSQKRLEHLKQVRSKLEPPLPQPVKTPLEKPAVEPPAPPKDYSTLIVVLVMVVLLIGALSHRALSP